jgi:hypothetical protein
MESCISFERVFLCTSAHNVIWEQNFGNTTSIEPTSGTFLEALYRYCACSEADGACQVNTYLWADDRGSVKEASGSWM